VRVPPGAGRGAASPDAVVGRSREARGGGIVGRAAPILMSVGFGGLCRETRIGSGAGAVSAASAEGAASAVGSVAPVACALPSRAAFRRRGDRWPAGRRFSRCPGSLRRFAPRDDDVPGLASG